MKSASFLLVEDDRDLRSVLTWALQRRGHQVTAVDALAPAMDLVESESYDVLVTDMFLGETDATPLLALARRLRPQMKLIAMSGGGNLLSASYLLNLAVAFGVTAPLVKPFSLDDFLHAIDSVSAELTPA